MYFRSILSGTLAAFLLFGPAQASDRSLTASPAGGANPGLSVPQPTGLPGVFSGQQGGTVQLAQASDPRVNGLEDQIRTLNGTIEELNFQILQMQEQLRKMQEDNEFRFQELESKKKADAGSVKTNRNVAENSATSSHASPAETQTSAAIAPTGVAPLVVDEEQPAAGSNGRGTPPKSFGTITFDASGNVTGGSIGDQIAADAAKNTSANSSGANNSGNTVVAALPATDNPDELYRNAYQFILSGDYGTAETGFRDHIARFPSDPKTADSHFWLGEALLGQQKYRDAAETFLAANKAYPKSKKAPDMLLKLGISLVGLNQRDVACATFGEIGKRYPDLSSALKDRVKQEQARAAC